MSERKLKVPLQSNDGKIFWVDKIVAFQSKVIESILDDDDDDNDNDNDIIPLKYVRSDILEKVIEFCKRHTDVENSSEEELKKFDDEFLSNLDQKMMDDVCCAANFLCIDNLRILTYPKASDEIRKKVPSPEE